MKSVLVVVAHADDEALGCGGTISRHVEQGDAVHLVLMADGVRSRTDASDADLARRIEASRRAQTILGLSSTHPLGLPDNRMDSVPLLELVKKLEPIIEEIRPTVIYTHHYGDLNIDHCLTHAAVMTACRPVPDSSVREIYGFEVLSSTEWATPLESQFVPNFFVDISQQLRTKLKALEAYAEEMREAPHSRSMKHVEVLARHRGYSIGIDAAEAFEVYRIIR
jgi:LmbE family N-acetylglucosaminyl deacetylase